MTVRGIDDNSIYTFELPDPPENKKLIYGWNKKKEDQYWVRPYSLSDEEFSMLSPEQQGEIVDTENTRCTEGFWFYNYGEPTYITGDNYFFLTHWTNEGQYLNFIKAQTMDFYFYDFCEKDPKCFGCIELKPRQEGSTSKKAAIFLNRAIRTPHKHFGIQSKTGDDARNVVFKQISEGFLGLPYWMKPRTKSEGIMSELNFSQPPQRFGRSKSTSAFNVEESSDKELYLNSKIDWKTTSVNGYDGKHLYRYIQDECFAKGTKILCEGFRFKNIEEICIGDKVIVEGGKLMEVGATCHGFDEMFKVKQPYGNDYVVNSAHRLYLEERNANKKSDNGVKIITPTEWMKLGAYKKRTLYRVVSNGLEFTKQSLFIEPYLFGLWLGDGSKGKLKIIVNNIDDPEISDYIINYCKDNSLTYSTYKTDSEKCIDFYIKSSLPENKKWAKNEHISELENIGVLYKKRIPLKYLYNTRESRLELLAGIIDTDGRLHQKGAVYDIRMANRELLEDIKTLASSLGFSTSKLGTYKSNFDTDYWILCIGGEIWNIPCKIERKKAPKRKLQYKNRRCKIDIKPIGIGEYFGITLKANNDDDRRLILEDFTISMNCFKWDTADAYETWLTVSRALGDDFQLWGKAFLLSTIGTDDEKEKASEHALINGRRLWDGSSFLERDDNGYTATKLYRWFVSPQHRKRGEVLDKYGNVNEVKVLTVLANKLAKEKDPRRRITIIRQDPINVQQALSTMGATGNTFPNIYERVTERYNFLNDYQPTAERPVKYRIGRLEWINNERFTKVKFVDDENGRFRIAYFPDIAGSDKTNRVKEIGVDLYAPYSDSPFCCGLDPVEYEEVQYGTGSQIGFHIKCKYNFFNETYSDVYCLEYLDRPDIPVFYEDVYKALFFYGARINIERAASQKLFLSMKQNGMKAFLMKRAEATRWNSKTQNDNAYGTPTSPRSIQAGLELIENYFSKPNPELNENEKDNLQYFWFDRSLKQILEYDIKNKTKFDLVSSMIQTEFASQLMKKRKTAQIERQIAEQEEQNSTTPKAIDYLFTIYQPDGSTITHAEYFKQQNQHQRRTV